MSTPATQHHIRNMVRDSYSAAAEQPTGKHAFPVGRTFAESLGYPPQLLASLPGVAIDAFTGVSNVSVFAEIPEGSTVLDLGCGAGLDSTVAAQRVGASGKVVGVDFSLAMLNLARQAAAELGTPNLEFVHGEAEHIPLADNSVDVALANGIFNLNPARAQIFQELARVLRSGGRVYAAELILCEPLHEPLPSEGQSCENWFA